MRGSALAYVLFAKNALTRRQILLYLFIRLALGRTHRVVPLLVLKSQWFLGVALGGKRTGAYRSLTLGSAAGPAVF